MSHIVVIGAGQAGSSLVQKLRELGFPGAMTLIGAEPVPPYQRPPLSKKYLLGDMTLDRMFLKPAAWYEDQGIRLRLGQPVVAVDVVGKTVTVGGEVLPYDQLALTTGTRPRRLPADIGGDLPGTHAVRTLADVDRMAPEFVAGRHLLVIGGGYIGLEAAAVAATRGLSVTVVESADRILRRVASSETSAYFRALHERHGVTVIEGTGLARLLGQGKFHGAELTDGRVIKADFAIIGVGAEPVTDLAVAAGIAVENGISVDEFGRTSAKDVWAAGDCASFPYRGQRIRLESVPHAIDQAATVAANMLGAKTPYVAEPWFWSDQYDVKLQIAGLNTGYDRVITRQRGEATSLWYYRGDTLLAVDAMKDPRSYMTAKRLLKNNISPRQQDVSDPSVDLNALVQPQG